MTGFKSKKAAALDEEGFYTAYPKEEDDDTQVYKDHGDLLTIAYQSGYYDGKKAAQVKVEGSLHVVCQCDKCKAQPAQEPLCPCCKAKVLYECVACSKNNYPHQGHFARAIEAALAQQEEHNFCSRCGKRTADLTTIHTCTPP
jgi:hypothetical protein